MFEFCVNKDMTKKYIIREVATWHVVAHLCLTLIITKLKIKVE
jgi:hypothetical protein